MRLHHWTVLTSVLCVLLCASALGNQSELELTEVTSFGSFAGIAYRVHQGTVTIEDSAPLSVVFVVPTDLSNGNRRLVLEPIHPNAGVGVRDDFLGHEFLFGQGFSHAAISSEATWQQIAAFGRLLREGQAEHVVGSIDKLYSVGFSASAESLELLLLEPEGQNLFDVSFILTAGWPVPTPIEITNWAENPLTYQPPETAGKVMVILTEADIVLWGPALRDDGTNPLYRSYEIAGTEHIPPVYGGQAVAYTPIIRALFTAGDRWASEGVAPPASTFLTSTAELDPVYDRMTGIARDENLNALGGISMPEVVLGQKQFVAVNTLGFVLMGTANDLSCIPLASGEPRFPSHDVYVRDYTAVVERLLLERLLLPEDAEMMLQAAANSSMGSSGACD